MLSRRRIVAIAVAAALMLAALVGVAAAQTGETVSEEPGKALERVDDAAIDGLQDEGDHADDVFSEGDCFFDEDWELTPEEIAEINAETDALVEYLQGLGFEVTVATDELGFTYIDFEGDDEGLDQAIEDFYSQMFADEVAGWSDEEKAEWNAEVDAFVAELAAEGITVETEEIAPGVYDIVWTEELEELLWDLEDELLFDEDPEEDEGEEPEDEDEPEDA